MKNKKKLNFLDYKNYIFFLPIVWFVFQYLSVWQKCRDFEDSFHFSSFDIVLKLEDAIRNDDDVPFFIIHFFHNKISGYVVNIFNHYLHYFDINFLIIFLSPIGCIGVILGIWYAITEKKNKKLRILLITLVALFPLIEIFFPRHAKMVTYVIVAFPFILTLVYGFYIFLSKVKNFFYLLLFFGLLSFISYYWIIFFIQDLSDFCFLIPH